MPADVAVLDESDQDFQDLVATLRAEMAGGRHAYVQSQLPHLAALAEHVRQRGQLAALEISSGAALGDWALHQRGLDRLRGAEPVARLDALSNINDLGVLGTLSERRAVLEECLQLHLPQLIHALRAAHLEVLLSPDDQLLAAPGLAHSLQREAGTWLAWSRLDLWLETRDEQALQRLQTLVAGTSSDAPGAWELQAVLAMSLLGRGKFPRAVAILSRLLEQNASSPVRVRVLRQAFLRYGVLGLSSDDFLALARRNLVPRDEVPDSLSAATHDRLTADTTALKRRAVQLRERALPRWAYFPIFAGVQLPRTETRELASLLMERSPDPERWMWTGRTSAFVARASLLTPSQRLAALAMARDKTADPAAERGIRDCLVDVPINALVRTWKEGHLDWLDVKALPTGRQKVWRRGGIYRVVIDGNNLGCGGGSNGLASLPRVLRAVGDLRAAGFEDVHIFFDVHRRAWLEPEWKAVQQMQNEGTATICDGKADPSVIRCFLQAPKVSWIVGRDRYSDHLSDFPDLRKWWPAHRLGFEIQRGHLHWRAPGDRLLEIQ